MAFLTKDLMDSMSNTVFEAFLQDYLNVVVISEYP